MCSHDGSRILWKFFLLLLFVSCMYMYMKLKKREEKKERIARKGDMHN